MAYSPAILIAHKDPLARAYLRHLAARTSAAPACREASSFNDAVDALAHDPSTSVALIDIDLPGMASDLGLRFFAIHYRPTRIVTLYSAMAVDRIDRLEEAGVTACVPKDLSESSLVDAFETLFKGDRYRAPSSSPPIAPPVPRPHEASTGFADHDLTERQGEVLRLLAMGRSNREIGHVLNIAEGTVKVHVNAAFRVLGVHNRVSAAAAVRKRFDEPQLDHHSHAES